MYTGIIQCLPPGEHICDAKSAERRVEFAHGMWRRMVGDGWASKMRDRKPLCTRVVGRQKDTRSNQDDPFDRTEATKSGLHQQNRHHWVLIEADRERKTQADRTL
jgi:hypothetical protein